MSTLYEQINPFRHPAWRQRRVLELVEADPVKRAHRTQDDKFVKAFRRFSLEELEANTPEAQMRLFHKSPGLFFANQFYNNSDPEWCAILDARILAREPNEFIADEFDTIPETIDWYEKIFFNMRDRLHSRTYVVKTITGHLIDAQTTDAEGSIGTLQRMLAYKLFAYFGGPLVLDIILFGFEEGSMPVKLERAAEWLDHSVKISIRKQAAITAKFMTINKFTMMQLLEIQQRFMTFESEARLTAGGAGANYQANIERFFEQIPLAIGTKSRIGRTSEALHFESTAVEPRAHEQLSLAQGTVPDALQQKLNYNRPDPSHGEGALTDARDRANE